MAEGDDAKNAGYPVVPPVGDEGLVKWGYREINRTRDFIAQLKNLIPTSKSGFRTSSGISSGRNDPSGGDDGDVYFKIVG